MIERATDNDAGRLGEAIALIEQARDIVDSCGLSIAAARIDQALVTLRAEMDIEA